MTARFKRILLKISGESLSGHSHMGVEKNACDHIAQAIKQASQLGIEIGLVIGGGNFFRGALGKELGLARSEADQIGMLATIMNGIFLSQALTNHGVKNIVMSPMSCGGIVEPFNIKRTRELLASGYVVIFVGGTGNPYFTTDSAAALRACEIEAQILFKATKVDGVYNKDPMKHKDAKKYLELSYAQALSEDLKVMDNTAIALCRESSIPIFVFNFFEEGSLLKAISHLKGGTIVS